MVVDVLSGVTVLKMRNVIQWKGPANVLREGLGKTAKRVVYWFSTESNLKNCYVWH